MPIGTVIRYPIAECHSHGGKGDSRDIAGFIEREFLSEEPEPASLEIAKEFNNLTLSK